MEQSHDRALPATEITALLGRGTLFEGKLHFDGRVRIDGIFKGEIKSDDTLIIGDGAEVHAEIEVATVIVRGGIVHGNIKAKNGLEIHAPGKVMGNIHSPSIFIERGVPFTGSCRMDTTDAPASQASLATPRKESDAVPAASSSSSDRGHAKGEKAHSGSANGNTARA